MSCGVGCRRSSDLALLWLWRRPAAVAPIGPKPRNLSTCCRYGSKKEKKKKNFFLIKKKFLKYFPSRHLNSSAECFCHRSAPRLSWRAHGGHTEPQDHSCPLPHLALVGPAQQRIPTISMLQTQRLLLTNSNQTTVRL